MGILNHSKDIQDTCFVRLVSTYKYCIYICSKLIVYNNNVITPGFRKNEETVIWQEECRGVWGGQLWDASVIALLFAMTDCPWRVGALVLGNTFRFSGCSGSRHIKLYFWNSRVGKYSAWLENVLSRTKKLKVPIWRWDARGVADLYS